MVKENSSSSESLPKEERFVINMSSELIAYLCNDYSYRNPNRFSRLKALQDLLIRFQKAKLASKDMDVNIAQLVKAWGWSRPAVLAFVDQLQKYEILEVCNMVTSKVVHLKPSIFSSGFLQLLVDSLSSASFLEDGHDGSIWFSASFRWPAISGKLLLSKARFPGALAPETVLFYNRGEPNPRFHG